MKEVNIKNAKVNKRNKINPRDFKPIFMNTVVTVFMIKAATFQKAPPPPPPSWSTLAGQSGDEILIFKGLNVSFTKFNDGEN